MGSKAAGVNPGVMRWARERAGLSLGQVAHAFKKAPESISAWETGEECPSYAQLEKLAYELYKRPLAVFFFPFPPEEQDPKTEFRLLPSFEREALEPDTLLAARQALSMQTSLNELTGGRNPAERLIFREIICRTADDLPSVCREVRRHLGVSLEEQCSWPNLAEAFKNWRDAIERKGVYVFKRSIKQREISGFCLLDPEFPVIYINNSTSPSRQIFTLFHELAHILFATSGLTKFDLSYLSALSANERVIEIACNRFAADFLIPEESLSQHLAGFDGSDEAIEDIASHFNVSREVVSRKLLDLRLIDQASYELMKKRWDDEWRKRNSGQGGNYYATQATYLGQNYLKLAFSRYYSGNCSLQDLAGHLNVKAKNIERLETFLTARGA